MQFAQPAKRTREIKNYQNYKEFVFNQKTGPETTSIFDQQPHDLPKRKTKKPKDEDSIYQT